MARSRLRLKCDGTLAETRFRLSAKRTSQFKSTGRRQFSRLLTAEVCVSAVVVLGTPCSKVVRRVLATHCIRPFPFTSPPLRHRVPSQFNWTLRHMFPVTAMPVPFAPCAVSVRCSDNSYPQTDSISGHRLREKPARTFCAIDNAENDDWLNGFVPKVCFRIPRDPQPVPRGSVDSFL
jgi:hypothetical protein